jgi:glycerophosphoryl diester phosphodiesterase
LPKLIAHRGASAKAPENSLEAFAQARADGADGIELDVLACASGEVVVFHDDDLLRLGGRPERVRALAWSELRGIKLLSGARIPLLSDVLAETGPLLVNVELKSDGRSPWGLGELAQRVAAIVAAAQAQRRVLVSSFHPLAVALWQRCCPGVPAALLYEAEAARPLRNAWCLPWLAPFAAHPEAKLCDEESLRRLRARDLRVHVWTVDEPAELRRLSALGVDGLITNDPAAARAVLSAP